MRKFLLILLCLLQLSPASAAMKINADGSATFTADDGSVAPQTVAKGQTQAQVDAAYAAYQATWSLAYWQAQKQAQLDAFYAANINLDAFIRGGTVTGVTATQVGTFLAQIVNNYRTLRASIAAAASISAVNAVNVQSGWPSNP